MTSTTCWRCLALRSDRQWSTQYVKIFLPNSSYSQRSATFTTSSTFQASPLVKKQPANFQPPTKRGQKTTFTVKKKKRPERTARPPATGERKALRKRIVLSNTNALEVKDMTDVDTESMLDEKLCGQVLGIPGDVIDQLRAAQAFKTTQGWGLFRRPGTLIRQETIEYGKLLESLSIEESSQTIRRIFVGEKGSGKSMLVLQAMTMAFLKKWIVINIPDGELWARLSVIICAY